MGGWFRWPNSNKNIIHKWPEKTHPFIIGLFIFTYFTFYSCTITWKNICNQISLLHTLPYFCFCILFDQLMWPHAPMINDSIYLSRHTGPISILQVSSARVSLNCTRCPGNLSMLPWQAQDMWCGARENRACLCWLAKHVACIHRMWMRRSGGTVVSALIHKHSKPELDSCPRLTSCTIPFIAM